MLVFSQITDAAAYMAAQQSDHSFVKSFRCDDVIAAMDGPFLRERACMVRYRICVTPQRPFFVKCTQRSFTLES